MPDHDTTRTDTRRRQREVADRVLADAGNDGATRAEVNAALAAAGVPVLETEAEWVALHDDEPDRAFEPNTVLGAG